MTEEPPIKIAVLAFDGANAVDIFGPLQVFSSASDIYKRQHNGVFKYDVKLFSLTNLQIKLHTQTRILTDGLLAELDVYQADTLIIAGGEVAPEIANHTKQMIQLREMMEPIRRVASVCSGAFILSATGLMDNRKTTTHWARYDEFSSRFPKTHLDIDALFTKDDKYYCSAGVTAGIDLALHLIEEDCGRRIALDTSREMVAFYHRPGGQNQFSGIGAIATANSDALILVQEWIEKNLNKVLRVDQLAELATMSVRNFSRKFTQETGLSPSRYIAKVRLNKARLLLEETNIPISGIAHQCGYQKSEILRRLFIRELKVSPTEYRKRFHIHH